jgi:hypothetical protein
MPIVRAEASILVHIESRPDNQFEIASAGTMVITPNPKADPLSYIGHLDAAYQHRTVCIWTV